jgi:DNA processing protein
MITVRKRLIHLHRCEDISSTTILSILKIDPSLESLYYLSPIQLKQKFKLPIDKSEIIYKNLHSLTIDSMLEQYKCQNIQCITLLDSSYPFSLKQLYNPPWVLYVKGKIEILENRRMLAIVGTRTPSAYGIQVAKEMVNSIVKNNWITVSGLATGIDTIVHKTTMFSKGKTIAVLGSGFAHIYPKENGSLATEIGNNHLLLSEYPPDTPPRKWYFPARNRIISGLSLGTVVVEAKERSGSLITANLALEQNREVFAIPGSIFSSASTGCNMLIQKGAKLVQTPQDILSEFDHYPWK